MEGTVYILGGRAYDEAHYWGISKENPAASRPIFVLVVLLFAITSIIYFSSDAIQKSDPVLTGFALRTVAPLLALLPAIIWLTWFYRLDALEPEPKRYVLGVFVLSGLLAASIGQPLISRVFQMNDWPGQNLWLTLLGSVLCTGFLQEFLKYAAVRYTVFDSPEFDERVDGITYAAAAGLGYATAINFQYMFSVPALAIGAGAAKFAINTLAHAAFAGVMGYFLALSKFDSKGRTWLPLGLIAAALTNGILSTLLVHVGLIHGNARGGEINHWFRLGTATILALVIYWVVFTAVRRFNQKTLAHNS